MMDVTAWNEAWLLLLDLVAVCLLLIQCCCINVLIWWWWILLCWVDGLLMLRSCFVWLLFIEAVVWLLLCCQSLLYRLLLPYVCWCLLIPSCWSMLELKVLLLIWWSAAAGLLLFLPPLIWCLFWAKVWILWCCCFEGVDASIVKRLILLSWWGVLWADLDLLLLS